MKEQQVTSANKFLYYIVAPCLLVYFILIDMSIIKCTFTILSIFSLAIIIVICINLIYKKKDSDYKFEVNNKYAKIMMMLVLFELAFNFSKF